MLTAESLIESNNYWNNNSIKYLYVLALLIYDLKYYFIGQFLMHVLLDPENAQPQSQRYQSV